jgi:hypothetical protein
MTRQFKEDMEVMIAKRRRLNCEETNLAELPSLVLEILFSMTRWTQLSAVNKRMRDEASERVNRRLLEAAFLRNACTGRVENYKLLSILYTLGTRCVIVPRSPTELFPENIVRHDSYLSAIVNPTRETAWNPWSALIIQHRGYNIPLENVAPEEFTELIIDALEAGFPPQTLCQLIQPIKYLAWVAPSWSDLAFILIAYECPVGAFVSLFSPSAFLYASRQVVELTRNSNVFALERFKRSPPSRCYLEALAASVTSSDEEIRKWAIDSLLAVSDWTDEHISMARWLCIDSVLVSSTSLVAAVVRRVPKAEYWKFECLRPSRISHTYSPRLPDFDVTEALFPDIWEEVNKSCRIKIVTFSRHAPVPAVHLDRVLPKERRFDAIMELLEFYFGLPHLAGEVLYPQPWIDLAINLRPLGLDLPGAVLKENTELAESLKYAMRRIAGETDFERILREKLDILPVC